MFRRKKLANTRRRDKDMGADRTPIRELLKQDSFRTELYSKLLEVIVNRLESQTKEVSESDLTLYVQQLFRVPIEEHRRLLERARQNGLSQQCVVRVHIQKAEKLAAKDSNGLSDPYCMLSIVRSSQFINLQTAKLNVVKSTSVKESTLSPEWNETFDLFVPRDDIDDSHVQLQLWDYDGNIQGSSKKLRGMKGMGRKMKEVVTSKDDEEDDFMGFNVVPLTKIPTEGLDSWFKLRPVHALQKVSGRIRFKLELNPLVHSPGDAKHPDDVILAALLTAVADRAHADFEAKRPEGNTEEWNGKLPPVAQTLVHAFSEQHLVKLLTRAIVRWEVYMGIHLQSEFGLDALFVDGLLKTLEANSHDLQEQEASSGNMVASRYTVDQLGTSLFSFLKKELAKISNHRSAFSSQMSNYIINLGNLLLTFKKLRSMTLYRELHKRTPSPAASPDVRDDVIAALVEGTEDYYVTLYDKTVDETLEEQDSESSGEDPPFGGQEAKVLIRLAEQLFRDLSFGQTIYHGVFSKILDIDYHSYVYRVVERNLARDVSEIMYKVNKTLSLIDDPNHVESETKSILLFRLYLTMRDLSSLAKTAKNVEIELKSSSTRSSLQSDSSNPSENGVAEADGVDPNRNTTDLARYYDWFRPTVIRWLQMSRGRTHDRLRKAVALDKTVAVDEIVKHTSSAVDTIGCLSGHVVAFWKSLSWPDPVDAYTIALRMTDDVANAIERYADLVHKKLKEVGFFDDEGRFDVTEELCLTLNNLQYVKSFIENLPEKMEFQAIANSVAQNPEGLSAERVLTTFDCLTKVAKIGMDKKIHSITSVVGSKMKPDIRRFLRAYAQQATRCGHGADFHQTQDSASRKKLLDSANVSIRPLMQYLHENTRTLHEWLCEPSFKRVLEVLWKVTVQAFRKLALSEYGDHRPFFFFQCRHVLNHHLVDFFHAEGSGISMSRMNSSEDYRILESELKMRCAKTQDLMRLFFMQMYDEQQRLASNPLYGYINVHVWYDPLGEEVNVDVISANELKPLDVNGLSDPFVTVKIAPTMMFRDLREEQTLVVKKTLDPLFENESFAFAVPKDKVLLDGAVVHFTVLDHDVIGSNDLEGESVLPLNMLDGVPSDVGGATNKISRNFRLPLTQPGAWCTRTNRSKAKQAAHIREANSHNSVSQSLSNLDSSFSGLTLNEDGLDFESTQNVSPLILINARSGFDKDADEFSRNRRRIKSIAEPEE